MAFTWVHTQEQGQCNHCEDIPPGLKLNCVNRYRRHWSCGFVPGWRESSYSEYKAGKASHDSSRDFMMTYSDWFSYAVRPTHWNVLVSEGACQSYHSLVMCIDWCVSEVSPSPAVYVCNDVRNKPVLLPNHLHPQPPHSAPELTCKSWYGCL